MTLCQHSDSGGYEDKARYLVESNRERYPDLLVEQMATAMRDAAHAIDHSVYCRELAIVALRMLRRAGKLKPTTDDERAAVELCGYLIDVPAARRRLLHPQAENYVDSAVATGQVALFDTSSQESVNKEEAA